MTHTTPSLIAALSLLMGCAHLAMEHRETGKISMDVDDEGMATFSVEVSFTAGSRGGHVTRGRYKLFLDDHLVGRSVLNEPFDYEAGEPFALTVMVTTPVSTVPAALYRSLLRGRVQLRLPLVLEVGEGGQSQEIILPLAGEVSVERLPLAYFQSKLGSHLVRVQQASVAGMKDGRLTLNVQVELKNPLPLGITVESLSYQVILNGQPLGAGEVSRPFLVAPEAKTTMNLPLEIPLTGLPLAVSTLLRGKDRSLAVKGMVNLEPLLGIASVPFHLKVGDALFRQLKDPASIIKGFLGR